jgi:DNA repair photolyase
MSTIMAAQPALLQPLLFMSEKDPVGPARLGKTRITNIDVKQILTKANGSMRDYDFSLNPYIGCGFACSYCFASFFQAEPERFDTWGQWVEIKANAVEVLKKKRDLKGKRIFMSSATDPYQPLEAKVELTRALVEAMCDPLRQTRLVVQTRGPLVTRDIDLLKRFERVRVNMSITTDSERVRKEFEPGCASIEKRLEAIAEVKAAGIKTSVIMGPMLPIEDPERWAKRLIKAGADHYVTAYFHRSDRQFAANTRPGALALAEAHGWTRKEYEETVSVLRKFFPRINDGSGGFEPI